MPPPKRPSFESGEDKFRPKRKPKEELARLRGEIGGGRPLLAWDGGVGEDDDTASDAPPSQLRRPTPQPPHPERNIPPIIPPEIPEPGEEEPGGGGGRSGPGVGDRLRGALERLKRIASGAAGVASGLGETAIERLERLKKREKEYERSPAINPRNKQQMAHVRSELGKRWWEVLKAIFGEKREPGKQTDDDFYRFVFENITEAMIDRAVVANWAEEQLYDNYEEIMTLFLVKFYDPAGRIDRIKELFRELKARIQRTNWMKDIYLREGKPGKNGAVAKGATVRKKTAWFDETQKVSPDDIPHIKKKLADIDEELKTKYFRKHKLKRWENLKVINIKEEERLNTEIKPFFKDFFINKGIMENWNVKRIKQAYEHEVERYFDNCLEFELSDTVSKLDWTTKRLYPPK